MSDRPFRQTESRRPTDAVSLILDRLVTELNLSNEIVEETRSILRVLKVKYPIGAFGGKKNDNERKRACALIEYTTRQHSGQRLPFDKLAKAAGMKVKDFRNLHETIVNFLASDTNTYVKRGSSSTSGKTTNVASARTRDDNGATKTSRSHTNTSSDINRSRTSTIPSLSIQLGAFVPNATVVATQAQRLYEDILWYAQNHMKPRDRAHCIQDIKQFPEEYEASCFFLVATSREHQGAKVVASQRLHNDDEYDKQLDMATLLDVCKDLTPARFEMILKYVGSLQQELKNLNLESSNTASGKDIDRLPAAKSLKRNGTQRQGSRSKPETSTASKKRQRTSRTDQSQHHESLDEDIYQKISNTSEETQLNIYSDFETGNVTNLRNQFFTYSPVFLEWKRRTLRNAYEVSERNMQIDIPEVDGAATDQTMPTESSTRHLKDLDFVASKILSKIENVA